MAVTIAQKIEQIKAFEDSVDQIILDLVKDREAAVIGLNAENQLFQSGQDGEGNELTPSYAPVTVRRKKKKGHPFDRVTLRDTGNFHKSLTIEYGADWFKLGSNDAKRAYLERKYGEQIYGLTPANIEQLTVMIRDQFIEIAKRKLL